MRPDFGGHSIENMLLRNCNEIKIVLDRPKLNYLSAGLSERAELMKGRLERSPSPPRTLASPATSASSRPDKVPFGIDQLPASFSPKTGPPDGSTVVRYLQPPRPRIAIDPRASDLPFGISIAPPIRSLTIRLSLAPNGACHGACRVIQIVK